MEPCKMAGSQHMSNQQPENTSSSLNVLQCNCRAVSEKSEILFHFVDKYDIDIFCLNETFLKPGHNFSISNFNTVSLERVDKTGGGVAFLIKNNLKFTVLNDKHENFIRMCELNRVEVLLVKMYYSRQEYFNFLNVYSSPRAKKGTPFTEDNFWNKFTNFCNSLDNLILVGDFNAMATTWSSSFKTNSEGRKLEQAMATANLIVLNDGEKTWSSLNEKLNSTLDLTFVSPNLIPGCIWEVLNYKFSSDHFPIKFSFNNKKQKFSPCRTRIVLKKVDWIKFTKLCEEQLSDLPLEDDDSYSNFMDQLTRIISESGGIKVNKINNNKKSNTWWNKECDEIMEQNQKNYENYKKNLSIQNLNKYLNNRKKGKKN